VVKKNVEVFNADVGENAGYRYTTNASYSSIVANERMSRAVLAGIGHDVRSVLDLGCGDGAYTAEILAARPSLRIVGIDAAAAAIDLASRLRPGIEFCTADAHELETWPDEQFDLAIARGVLHHVADPERAIVNLVRAAKRVLILEPNGNNPVLKLIEKISPYHREHEERSFTAPALRRWARRAGARVVSTNYIGFVPFFFPTGPARAIHAVQPFFERVPGVRSLFSAQIVMLLERA